MPSRHRVVVLCGPELMHLHTCARLIHDGVHVVGICICDQRTGGLPLRYVRRSIRQRGLARVTAQILGRLYYLLWNRHRDRELHARLYDKAWIRGVLEARAAPEHRTTRYDAPATLDWLRALEPDLLVVHTPYWVGKCVRAIPKLGIVIGGHPGLTPRYRGSHSAFWAVLEGRPEDVGCTAFFVGGRVDAGDIIAQERIAIEPGDSFFTLGWKSMIRLAEMQSRTIRDYDRGLEIPRRPVGVVPEGSEYGLPTLWDYLRYRRRQQQVR